MYGVSHHNGELFALRLLLSVVKGATSFEDLATCDGDIHPTFRSACFSRGMMADDTELIATFEEIIETTVSVDLLRKYFVTMLLHGGPHDPRALFDRFVDDLSDSSDGQHHVAAALHALEDVMRPLGRSLTEKDFGFILPECPDLLHQRKRRRRDGMQIGVDASRQERDRLLPLFTAEQLDALRKVVDALGTGEIEHTRDKPTINIECSIFIGIQFGSVYATYNTVACKASPHCRDETHRLQQRICGASVSWMREDCLCQRFGSVLPCGVSLRDVCCRQCIGSDAAIWGFNSPRSFPSPNSLQRRNNVQPDSRKSSIHQARGPHRVRRMLHGAR